MRNGRLFQRRQWVRLIYAKESSSLLPTVTASDGTMGAILNENTQIYWLKSGKPRKISNNGVDGSVSLARFVKLMPTLTSQRNPFGGSSNTKKAKAMGLMPTLDANDGIRGCASKERWNSNKQKHIIDYLRHEAGDQTLGQLNPAFCEWLMGYPIGHTALKDSATQ
jgi:hypothetical protein